MLMRAGTAVSFYRLLWRKYGYHYAARQVLIFMQEYNDITPRSSHRRYTFPRHNTARGRICRWPDMPCIILPFIDAARLPFPAMLGDLYFLPLRIISVLFIYNIFDYFPRISARAERVRGDFDDIIEGAFLR